MKLVTLCRNMTMKSSRSKRGENTLFVFNNYKDFINNWLIFISIRENKNCENYFKPKTGIYNNIPLHVHFSNSSYL